MSSTSVYCHLWGKADILLEVFVVLSALLGTGRIESLVSSAWKFSKDPIGSLSEIFHRTACRHFRISRMFFPLVTLRVFVLPLLVLSIFSLSVDTNVPTWSLTSHKRIPHFETSFLLLNMLSICELELDVTLIGL